MTGDWLETDFAAWFEYHDPAAGHRQVSPAELLDGELASLHERLVDAGTPSKYLAGWFAGLAGRSVGFAVLAAGAWFELEAEELRWHVHPDGWADRLELGTPRTLGALGRPGLWTEVADGLGGPLAFQSALEVTPASVALLERLVAVRPGRRARRCGPWTACA